jgi:hypothetical protein
MKRSAHVRRQAQKEKRDTELVEIEQLEAKLKDQEPPSGVREVRRRSRSSWHHGEEKGGKREYQF